MKRHHLILAVLWAAVCAIAFVGTRWYPLWWLRLTVAGMLIVTCWTYWMATEYRLRQIDRLLLQALTATVTAERPGGWGALRWHDEVQRLFDDDGDGVNPVAWRRRRIWLHLGGRRVTIWCGQRRRHSLRAWP